MTDLPDKRIPDDSPFPAELVEETAASNIKDEASVIESQSKPSKQNRSWVFRLSDWFVGIGSKSFGLFSVVLIVAVVANIPIVQFIAFGYLLAIGGAIATSGKLRDGLIDLDKFSQIGSIIVGTFLVLVPARIVAWLRSDALLIDPESSQSRFLGILLVFLIVGTIPHIMAAWFCGGKLRHFLWPMVAPFSFGLWLFKRIAGSSALRPILDKLLGWVSPHLVSDLVDAKPVTDWFMPAIVYKNLRNGSLINKSIDQTWEFTQNLKLGRLFGLGFWGFVGSFAWLVLPTALMFRAIGYEDGLALLCVLLAFPIATFVFGMLPFLQARFAETGQLSSFLEVGVVWRRFKRSPLLHLASLLVLLLLALPMFLLKVEQIPSELLWSLSLAFVLFSLPGRFLIGWAAGRGNHRENVSAWYWRWPIAILMPVVSFVFVFVFFFSPFVAWHGAYSLFENHVFLLPAPFWVSYFLG